MSQTSKRALARVMVTVIAVLAMTWAFVPAALGDTAAGLTYTIKDGDYGYGAYVTDCDSITPVIPNQLGGADVVEAKLTSKGLTALDVSAASHLVHLSCSNNKLTALDVSHNANLAVLGCSSNLLTALDVSHNASLVTLGCLENQIESITFGSNSALEDVTCTSNNLSSIDLSGLPALEVLYLTDNHLSSIDTSHNPVLKKLVVSANANITDIDVSANTELENLGFSKCGV